MTLVESTSPSSLLCGVARRGAAARPPPTGASCSRRRSQALRARARAIRAMPGLDVLDERIVGRPGVHGYDPLRLAIDVRGTGRHRATRSPR